ncbi:MAG: sulfite exporter TauE/SafE family protein [Lentisphaerales bacterium]|nr:MAG: sulfite exporter TauE/SafE family protein [Lentisphaerales bacterium]
MNIGALGRMLCRLPGLRRRRVRVSALLLVSIVGILGLRTLMPELQLMPAFARGLAPGVALGIFLAALICEYIDSSLGMGYGTALTPLLLLAGFEPLQIVPCVLLSEFATGIAAVFMHQRDGNVDLLRDPEARSAALMLSVLSVAGTIGAVVLAVRIPKNLLTGIIGTIVVIAGIVTLATIRRQLRFRRGHRIAIGAVAAFNKGLSGGGYGPLVTSGQVISGLSSRKAVAVTSLAESLTCFVGLIAYLLLHKGLDWGLAFPLTLGAMLSVPVATLTVRQLPERGLRAGVGVATCLLGVLMLAKLFW